VTGMDRDAIAGFSLAAPPPGFVDDPYPTYAALRAHDPVHQLAPGSVLLTRYDDVLAVYRSPHASSDKREAFAQPLGRGTPIYEHHTSSLVFNDPPLHTRVRRLLMGALNQRAIARMEAGVVSLVDRLLDELADQPAPDLIEHFAAQIPVEVIGNLLAVPRDEREPLRPSCRRWSRRRRRRCWHARMRRPPTSWPTCAGSSPTASATPATPRPTC